MPGDAPGEGQIDGKGKIDTDSEGCGRLCGSYEECCSYEHSPRENLCNLNKDCEPSATKHKDYNFCSKKEKGEKFAKIKEVLSIKLYSRCHR